MKQPTCGNCLFRRRDKDWWGNSIHICTYKQGEFHRVFSGDKGCEKHKYKNSYNEHL